MYFAPSDPTGLSGFYKEHICATPSWRNRSARYDTVLLKTGLIPGPNGLSVARLLLLFSFKFEGTVYPTALVEWFSFVKEGPEEDTGMWITKRETHPDGSPHISFISTNTIIRNCHLIPVYGTSQVPLSINPQNVLTAYKAYYLNKFIDHHGFEILS